MLERCLLYYKENDRKPAPTIELSFKRCTKYRTSFLLYYNRGDNMNDKDIRKILINFLLAERQDIRIYQEKSIGSSICDVRTSQTPLFELLEKVAEDDTNSFTLEERISLYSKAI